MLRRGRKKKRADGMSGTMPRAAATSDHYNMIPRYVMTPGGRRISRTKGIRETKKYSQSGGNTKTDSVSPSAPPTQFATLEVGNNRSTGEDASIC